MKLEMDGDMSIINQIEGLVSQHFLPMIHVKNTTPNSLQAPGGICGVLYKGEPFFFPYGVINENGTKPSENTIFGLGSVTKTFTTSILGQNDSKLFTKPVNEHLPKGYDLQPEERLVTFEQLATFTGGIVPSVPQSPTDPITQIEFIDFINSRIPNGNLPTKNVYSDSSIGFLAQILMWMSGYRSFDSKSTNTWLQTNLLTELQMNNSGTLPNIDTEHPLSDAFMFDSSSDTYSKTAYAEWVPWGAAGRAYSTCKDMMNFVMANVGISTIEGKIIPPIILNGMKKAQKPYAEMGHSGKDAKQAFSWILWKPDSKDRYVGKDGGIKGVSSYVTAMPSHQIGVVFLTNMQGLNVQDPALSLTEALLKL